MASRDKAMSKNNFPTLCLFLSIFHAIKESKISKLKKRKSYFHDSWVGFPNFCKAFLIADKYLG